MAIADTEWVANGAPMIRLHKPPLLSRFGTGFEIAMRVAAR
jgi:hypothetical protein